MTDQTFTLSMNRTEVAAVSAAVAMFRRGFVKAVEQLDSNAEEEAFLDGMIMHLEVICEKLRPLLEEAAMTFVNEYESVGINMSVEDIIGTPFDEKEGK